MHLKCFVFDTCGKVLYCDCEWICGHRSDIVAMTLMLLHGETHYGCILSGEADFNVPMLKVSRQTVLILAGADIIGAHVDMLDQS